MPRAGCRAGRGFGCIGNIIVGLIGAVIGGYLASILNITGTYHFWSIVLLSFIGACIPAYLLIDGVNGVVATISRVALAIFIIFYPTADGLLGIGTGILVRYAAGFPPSQQAILETTIDVFWRNPIVDLIASLGSLGWIMGVLTAAIALSRPSQSRLLITILVFSAVLFGAWSRIVFIEPLWWIGVLIISLAFGLVAKPHLPVGLLVSASFLFGADHAPPFGPLGMASFFLAALQLELLRQKSASTAPELTPDTLSARDTD